MSNKDSSRAPVVAAQGDAAAKARHRDEAQRIVLATEAVLGERFNIAARHELTDRIAAALDAAPSPSSPDGLYEAEDVYSDPVPAGQKHLCPHCGRRMRSDFDEDVGMWYECQNCDYREAVSSAAATPTPVEQEQRAFADLLPLSAVRVAPGEYEIKSRDGRTLWRMEGASLADWVCASVNGYDAALSTFTEKCARCNATGETEGYGGNNVQCGLCAGTGRKPIFVTAAPSPSAAREAAESTADEIINALNISIADRSVHQLIELRKRIITIVKRHCSPVPAAGGDKDGWFPIATAPRDGTEIILAHGNSQWMGEWITDPKHEVREGEGGFWMMCDQWVEPEMPSHWRP